MNIQPDSVWIVILLGSILAFGQIENIDQGAIVGITYINHFFLFWG